MTSPCTLYCLTGPSKETLPPASAPAAPERQTFHGTCCKRPWRGRVCTFCLDLLFWRQEVDWAGRNQKTEEGRTTGPFNYSGPRQAAPLLASPSTAHKDAQLVQKVPAGVFLSAGRQWHLPVALRDDRRHQALPPDVLSCFLWKEFLDPLFCTLIWSGKADGALVVNFKLVPTARCVFI